MLAGARFDDIGEPLHREAHRLLADLEHFAKPAAHWNRPPVAVVLSPFRRDGRIAVKKPTVRQVVGEKVLRAVVVWLSRIGRFRFGGLNYP